MVIKFPKTELAKLGRKNLIFLDELDDLIELEINEEAIDKQRTDPQNRSLHKLFSQIADACNEKGISFFQLIKEPAEIECTPENIKMLWKKLQQYLFGKKSTTQLKKTGEIDKVYDTFNKVLIERTKGQVVIPPFPHREKVAEERQERQKIEYPKSRGEITDF